MPSSGVRIAVWPQPSSRSGWARAVLGDPAVVRLEAGLLVVEVVVVAEHHADGRVDDLGGDAVAVLVGHAAPRDPSRRGAARRTSRRARGSPRPACRPRRRGPSAPGVFMPSMTNTSPTPSPPSTICGALSRHAGVDVVDVGVRRLGDVRVGRDDRIRGPCLPCVPPAQDTTAETAGPAAWAIIEGSWRKRNGVVPRNEPSAGPPIARLRPASAGRSTPLRPATT